MVNFNSLSSIVVPAETHELPIPVFWDVIIVQIAKQLQVIDETTILFYFTLLFFFEENCFCEASWYHSLTRPFDI